jgi:hypothetical protein
MSDAPCYAVFSEFSPTLKPMQPGMNTRVFNHVDAHSSDGAIDLDESTGVITLAPGTYHMTGFSTTIYYTGKEPPGTVEPRSPANGGYCRLRRAEEDLRTATRASCLAVSVRPTASPASSRLISPPTRKPVS